MNIAEWPRRGAHVLMRAMPPGGVWRPPGHPDAQYGELPQPSGRHPTVQRDRADGTTGSCLLEHCLGGVLRAL